MTTFARNGRALASGAAFILVGALAGVVLPSLVMSLVARVNDWDDAPGGGIILLLLWFVCGGTGSALGLLCAQEAWKERNLPHKVRLAKALKGSLTATAALSLLLPAAIALWTAPPTRAHRITAWLLAVGLSAPSLLLARFAIRIY